MENAVIALDSTVRSQDSNNSKDSSISDSKPESCLESKHSKEILISEKQQSQQQRQVHSDQLPIEQQRLRSAELKDDSNLLMFMSCGQLLLGESQISDFSDTLTFRVPTRSRICLALAEYS